MMEATFDTFSIDFEPEVSISSVAYIENEYITVDLQTRLDSNEDWALFINDVVEITSDSWNSYPEIFDDALGSITDEDEVLIVGGGDLSIPYALFERLRGNYYLPHVTVIDPLVNVIQDIFSKIGIDKRNIGRGFLQPVPLLFSEYLHIHRSVDPPLSPIKASWILVDVSDDTMNMTKEIYNKEFFVQLRSLLRHEGKVLMYLGNASRDVDIPFSELGFRVLGHTSKYIEAYKEEAHCIRLQRI